jgi:hypothetical protein
VERPALTLKEDVSKINSCLSLCKDFWRDLYLVLDTCPCNKIQTWEGRHSRFVSNVQPLDILEGYDDDGNKDYVYLKHEKFGNKK